MARKSKRGNRKFTDPEGNIWDSKFEWIVYTGLRDQGYMVARCDERDSIAYHTPVHQGRCLECDANGVVQDRSYTPDLRVGEPSSTNEGRVYYIECKGYFPPARRAMLRDFKKQHQGIDLRFLFAKEAKLTKARTNIEYVLKMIKAPAGAWNDGALEWRFP